MSKLTISSQNHKPERRNAFSLHFTLPLVVPISSTIPFLASFRLPSTMAIDNVVLNIYDLLPGDQSQAASSSSRSSSLTSFFSGMLAPLGMGAYHTSIDVRGEISFCFMMPTTIR